MRLPARPIALSFAAVALLAVALGLVMASRGPGNSATTPPPSPPAVASASQTGGQSRPTRDEVPTVSIADFRWTSFHGVRVPVSSAGPRTWRPDGTVAGFADTPTGALLAAIHIMLRLEPAYGPAVYRPTVQRQVVGTAKAAAAVDIETEYQEIRQEDGVPDGQPANPPDVRVIGFRLASYSPAAATVHLLLEASGSTGEALYGDSRTELTWASGDWRVVAPPDGDWEATTTLVGSADGYDRLAG